MFCSSFVCHLVTLIVSSPQTPHRSRRQAFGVTLEEFSDAISQAKSKLDFRPGEERLYRVSPTKMWPLLPSLLRHSEASGLDGDKA